MHVRAAAAVATVLVVAVFFCVLSARHDLLLLLPRLLLIFTFTFLRALCAFSRSFDVWGLRQANVRCICLSLEAV